MPMLRQLNLAFNDLTVDDAEHLSCMLVQLAPSLQVRAARINWKLQSYPTSA